VTGRDGTGKSTISRDLSRRFAANRPTPDDWLMVNNFKDEYRPRAIRMPAGQGAFFARKVNRVVQDLKVNLPNALESESHLERKNLLEKAYTEKRARLLDQLEKLAAAHGLQISRTPSGLFRCPSLTANLPPRKVFCSCPRQSAGRSSAALLPCKPSWRPPARRSGA
jgi:hypothetical protein